MTERAERAALKYFCWCIISVDRLGSRSHSPRPPGDTSHCIPCPKDLTTCQVCKHCGSERKVSCQSGAKEYQVTLGAYSPALKVFSRGGVPREVVTALLCPGEVLQRCLGPPDCDSSAPRWEFTLGSVTLLPCTTLLW